MSEERPREMATSNVAPPEPGVPGEPGEPDRRCYACDATGKASRGWSGNPSPDGATCPDCRGTGVDATPHGTGSDHCSWCASDWRQPHYEDCPAS